MNILINGDSWGCGEWSTYEFPNLWLDDYQHGNTHFGLEQFLIDDGYNVKNLSIGGNNNLNIYKKTYIELKYNQKKWNKLIIFQTSSIRSLGRLVEQNKLAIKNIQDLIQYIKEDQKSFYHALNSLNIPTAVLGGCMKVDVDILSQYPNLYSPIPSILEFLIPNFKQPRFWGDFLYTLNEKNTDLETLNQVVDEINLLWNLSQKSRYFIKDITHPDRKAHFLIFQKLKEDFLN
jgi:hypothetical protein